MSTLSARSPFVSSVGRKFAVSITGLFLISFLIVHLSGNLLLLKGDGGIAFNEYAKFMATNPIIKVMEFVLFAGFILHIGLAIKTWLHNRSARPVGYRKNRAGDNSSFFSRFMIASGTIVLIFLIVHLINFWVPHRFGILEFGDEPASLYHRSAMVLSNPIFAGVYLVSFVLLCFHLLHGFQSAFQTLGLQVNKQVGRVIKGIGVVFSIVVTIGFMIIPIYFLVTGGA
jgi:succinate dehydrogenase / fumarate reductase cytochrome b subunit